MNNQTMGLLHGSRAIADYLDQSSHVTVCGWIDREGLPATWLGNAYVTTKSAVDTWFNARLKQRQKTPHRRPSAD